MNKLEFDSARMHHLGNKNTKKGIELFEKYIGRIEWLHTGEQKYKIEGRKKYNVINKLGEVVFQADKISDIAKEFCVSKSRVGVCINSISLLHGEYLIERCKNE